MDVILYLHTITTLEKCCKKLYDVIFTVAIIISKANFHNFTLYFIQQFTVAAYILLM